MEWTQPAKTDRFLTMAGFRPVVMENTNVKYKELRNAYDHALDRIYELFKLSHEREQKMEHALELARDELMRIKACPDVDPEIKQLCERGLADSKVS